MNIREIIRTRGAAGALTICVVFLLFAVLDVRAKLGVVAANMGDLRKEVVQLGVSMSQHVAKPPSPIIMQSSCDLDDVNDALDDIGSDVSGIESYVSGIQSNVSDIQSRMRSIESDVSSIESDVSSIQIRLPFR